MSRREVRGEYAVPPSNCAKVLYYTWKLCSVVFSHLVMISLVVAYCILGAVTFEKLESQHEIQVKQNISQIRNNATTSIWRMTKNVPLLDQTNWTTEVVDMLKDFENAIILEMKVRGWDGSEQMDHVQWTFTGALFYSIIVITTIGYGHITPKTQTGKVVTIFYAILGIPLMLLCLSNIGDVMASSFRFLYWRACCYVCTRPPSRRRRRHHSAGPTRRSIRGRPASIRRRARAPLERCYSDTDCRYRDSGYSSGKGRRPRPLPPLHAAARPRPKSQPPPASALRDYEADTRTSTRPTRHTQNQYQDEENFPKISLPLRDLEAALKDLDEHQKKTNAMESRSKSLPKQSKLQAEFGSKKDWDTERHYELDDCDAEGLEMHDLHDVDYENYKERKAIEERERKRREREEYDDYRERDYDPDDDEFEFDGNRGRRYYDDRRWGRGRSEYVEHREPEERRLRDKRARSAFYDYERRPDYDRPDRYDKDEFSRRDDGRNRRLRRLQTVDDTHRSRYSPSPEVEWSDEEAQTPRKYRHQAWNQKQHELYPVPSSDGVNEELKPVPIWLCVFLVASYIVAGTFLFKRWEGWPYLDAAYFCFITLTTIGFGDFVPAQSSFQGHYGEPTAAVHSIALCSLYLLFGIALLAMSFNLVQEEVRANVAALATKLGIIKAHSNDEETDSDY